MVHHGCYGRGSDCPIGNYLKTPVTIEGGIQQALREDGVLLLC